QVQQTTVPDMAARESASPDLQPYLNAFPVPNGTDDPATGIAQFNASYSNRSSLDAYSLRIDHNLAHNITLFGRYNYSPSDLVNRGNGGALSIQSPTEITTQTMTAGTTWQPTPHTANDVRFNYSHVSAGGRAYLDSFGGAVPLSSLPFPPGFNEENGLLLFDILNLQGPYLEFGQAVRNVQKQINLVDSFSVQKGTHAMKFGVDYRRLSPDFDPLEYEQAVLFRNVAAAQTGTVFRSIIVANSQATLLFRNLGLYAQDTWRLLPRLTLTYGLRWDLDFTPESKGGPHLPAVTGFNLNDFSQLTMAPD